MDIIDKTFLNLVQFEKSDVPGLINLSGSIGWDYDENEIGTVMESGKIFGHKNPEGKIVSSAAIIEYDTKLASIGMVIVDKGYRGLGLGKDATQMCIDSVLYTTSIMLIATEEGKPLYENMGFVPVDSVHKYLCENYSAAIPLKIPSNYGGTIIEDFKDIHFNEVLKIDEAAFGDRRSNFLHKRINQSEHCIVVKDHNANVIGYGAAILGPVNLILGPIVAPDFQIAALIIDSLALRHQGKIRIDVPSGNEEFMIFLQQRGFNMVSNPPIMVINSANMPQRDNTLFGIAAQIFG
ncbi:GNAT family N-acetyltransferase [Metabacillus idriensis]|uniref:GNAT family N-acetyltransferase n=1 Tax=Metabacillus idriensis TaxID=324768 RepID=UPI00174827E2|nr:GNAT family N-acetyltransferase [Metabacillus idriensis]